MNEYQIAELERQEKLEIIGQESEWGLGPCAVAELEEGRQHKREFGGDELRAWRERQTANPLYVSWWYTSSGEWTRTESTDVGAITAVIEAWNCFVGSCLDEDATREQIRQMVEEQDERRFEAAKKGGAAWVS